MSKSWTMRDGKTIKFGDMSLGHLTSTIKMLSAKLEQARSEGDSKNAKWYENQLLELQTEYDSRDKEIDQMLGIFSALQRGSQKE